MKIALIGATGYVGAHLLLEALERGHEVTAIVTHIAKLPTHERLTPVAADATDSRRLAERVAGHDVVISAYNPVRDGSGQGSEGIIQGVKHAKVPRLLVVGGAGSLKVASGARLVDQPDFPAEWKETALRTAAVLDRLEQETDLDWAFLSPAAELVPGERSGHYRVGTDQLLVDDAGHSRISVQDYAVAMLDEAEHPRHHRQRFTVAN